MQPDHRAWFTKADEDLAMIDIGLAGNAPLAQLCVHAQQLAEKYLKGYLVSHDVLPPKVHDLERLLDLSVVHDASLEFLRGDCVRLVEVSGHARYPGWDDPGESAATEAIAAARRVRSAIRERTASDTEA
jgi:HEPN domain-containing protein